MTSSTTVLVAAEIRLGETSVPYISSRCAWISAHRHAVRMQQQDLVVEARPAGLVLRNQLRLEAAVPITRNLDRQLAELALSVLRPRPLHVLPAALATGSCLS